ncbi:hypothetical protein [Chryseobacterium sp. MA9]|nr:hypothetical protein [Chryseobacterium sp. MA9]UTX48813.1 hypothetical protein KIK00_00660 [Chryseobacterium sp. MA9]
MISVQVHSFEDIIESEGKGNRFYNNPVPVGGFIAVGDFLDNVYVFEPE